MVGAVRPSVRVAAVSAYPGVGPCPVPLDELLRAVDRAGRFQHLSVSRLSDGRYQVSFKPVQSTGYRVVISEDITEAVQSALGPAYGHEWSEVLGDDPLPPEWSEDSLEDLL